MMLKGERCFLRQASLDDIDDIVRWENDTDHWLVSSTTTSYSKEEVAHFIKNENDIFINNQMRLMIFTHEKHPLGCIDLYDLDVNNKRVGVGILIDQAYRGKGFGHEALQLLSNFCFHQLDVRSIYADVLVTNTSSIRLFESAGFKLFGTKKDWVWDGDQFIDQNFYQRIKDQ